MSIFDLLFIVVFLGTAAALIFALVSLLRRRRDRALRTLRNLGICLGVYFLIVVVVDIAAPQHVLKLRQDRCFDEICFAATDVKTANEIGPPNQAIKAKGQFYIVTVRVHSHARGRPQSEAGVNASLVDSHSRSYQISEVGQRAYEAEHGPTPPLTDRLQPGQTIESVLVFDVPAGASDIALNLGHNGPGLFIIGDDESALHKPTIIRLNS